MFIHFSMTIRRGVFRILTWWVRLLSRLCKAGALDPKKVKGTILVCLRGDNARVDKGQQDALAGAVGMVPANDYASGDEIIADPHVLPATQISYTDGLELFAYVNSTSFHYTSNDSIGNKAAPVMAAFSSIGPNTVAQEILKVLHWFINFSLK